MNARGRSVAPAVLVGLLGFLVTVELNEQRGAAEIVAERRAQLAQVVAARQQSTARLEERLAELRRRAGELSGQSRRKELRELQALAEQFERVSGAVPVTGPGVIVTLSDSREGEEDGPKGDDFRIQDADLQAVVNALWGAGAEAIAVNGQRVVATTAIRNAGAAVLVNYRVLTSPYSVRAVGDARAIAAAFERSEIAKRFRNWVEIYGLGFGVATSKRLELPGFDGVVRFRYAKEIEEGT